MNKEEYDDENNNYNKSAEGNYDNNSIYNESESAANTTGKDIKKGMDKYKAKMKQEKHQQVTPQGLRNN
jgi:hypothetical protein